MLDARRRNLLFTRPGPPICASPRQSRVPLRTPDPEGPGNPPNASILHERIYIIRLAAQPRARKCRSRTPILGRFTCRLLTPRY